MLATFGLIAAVTLGPVVVHDSRETSELGSVAGPGAFAAEPVVYERQVGEWRQWWLGFAQNDQDRGIVRTGRHAGDWELIQIREGVEAVYSQHSGAERCPWSAVELARRPTRRVSRQRLPRRVLPAGHPRSHVAGPQRRGRRPRRTW